MQIACRSGRSIDEARDQTTPRQLIWWRTLLGMEQEEAEKREWGRHRSDWYQARNAYLLYALIVQVGNILNDDPQPVEKKIEDFLIDFTFEEKDFIEETADLLPPGVKLKVEDSEEDEEDFLNETEREEAYQKALEEYCREEKAKWASYLGQPVPER